MGEIARHVVEAGGRFSARLEAGDLLRIVDTHGQQAVDFLCYAATLPAARYNAPNTMKINGNIYLGKGSKLYSDRAQVLMRIVEDTCGRHDTIGGCCSAWSNFARYGVKDTPGCHANFVAELATWSLSPSDVVTNVNFFIELVAEVPVIAVLSNCPQRNNPAAGFGPTPIEVIIRRA
jgi:uncharacterized protein YcgI (DUF1989 family)